MLCLILPYAASRVIDKEVASRLFYLKECHDTQRRDTWRHASLCRGLSRHAFQAVAHETWDAKSGLSGALDEACRRCLCVRVLGSGAKTGTRDPGHKRAAQRSGTGAHLKSCCLAAA